MRDRLLVIVEEDRLLRWSLQRKLAQAGLEAIETGSAAEALRELERWKASRGDRCPERVLAFIDQSLPDGDGIDLADEIRGACPGCTIILITADASEESAARARRGGVDRVLDKPFNLNSAIELVQEIWVA